MVKSTKSIGEMISGLREDISLSSLLSVKENLESQKDLSLKGSKLLAEVLFLLAREYSNKNEGKKAERLAKKAKDKYQEIDVQTLEDSTPILWQHLPERMHEGVVDKYFS